MNFPRVITVAAFKGGVGKTTTTANLAVAFAQANPSLRGLVIDLDPQANLTDAFASLTALDNPANTASLLEAVMADPSRRLLPSDVTRIDLPKGHLDLLPSTDVLANVGERAVSQAGGERLLRQLLNTAHGYDFILIDTPPSEGRLTMNAVCASTHVVAVINPSHWSARGASRVSGFVQRNIQYSLSNAEFIGSVVNKYENGRRVGRDQVMTELHDEDAVLLEPVIPQRTIASDAELLGNPLILEAPKSDAARAYRKLSDNLWALTANSKQGVA